MISEGPGSDPGARRNNLTLACTVWGAVLFAGQLVLLRLLKSCALDREECNKYDLTAATCFFLSDGLGQT
jgi:hypothetical protein